MSIASIASIAGGGGGPVTKPKYLPTFGEIQIYDVSSNLQCFGDLTG